MDDHKEKAQGFLFPDHEALAIEASGAKEGINPVFGTWKQKFLLEPVSYANPGAARAAFKRAVQEQLNNKFVFTHEVVFTATLYLNEQKMMETPAYGDLDNYAKQLLDVFKGAKGLFIDDCQVQRLDISWIDIHEGSWFEVEIKGSLDDFMPLPIKLYEMPDGLFYPLSNKAWTKEGIVESPVGTIRFIAEALAKMTGNKVALRHQLREGGVPRFRAFQLCQFMSPILKGFHKSRVVDSGFELVERRAWMELPELQQQPIAK
jgi:Holliday junction resolvase RusA-like endonuclease